MNPMVFYKTCTPFKSFSAYVTLIGFLSGVGHGLLVKGLFRVVGILYVDSLVLSEVRDVTEVFPTVIAMVRLHFSKRTFALSKKSVRLESDAEVATLVRFASLMNPHMLIKGWALTESPPADATFKRLLSGVGPLMLNKGGTSTEGFPAFLTLEGFLPAVCDLMLSQRRTVSE